MLCQLINFMIANLESLGNPADSTEEVLPHCFSACLAELRVVQGEVNTTLVTFSTT